ncbi:MAG: L-serine ammonia-lyase [Candidatus Fischerbacteria bacterium RBG_13_37_8]|uniref:L-serine dehydratase n=1 Tax=Candidatus Fischerbacteria bacterium RBG_13_37_8 TaxID=1817863 RepID=A0A1F5VDV2_9BACT|nr:MAG: L-serine ammonia-lyase [Candidatus Fischerbacteria bacterium RBG_13_37_8]
MESLRELFRIGYGPSSSHTMGPKKAAELFKARHPKVTNFRITLYGSLAATGKGHLTDIALKNAFQPNTIALIFKPEIVLPFHPNGMEFESLDASGIVTDTWRVYSVGGGAISDGTPLPASSSIYKITRMTPILNWIDKEGKSLWEYVADSEDEQIWEFLQQVWDTMKAAIQRGIEKESVLPGVLKLPRKAASYYIKSRNLSHELQKFAYVFAYALAVSEENASGGKIVTAPTCGSCGIVPAVLYLLQTTYQFSEQKIWHALASAGLIGNIVKFNGSISGAEVGCGGEVGVACAMAAGAAAQLLGGTPSQIEYAAEIALEHHLGLTCDPVEGLVQIPCIERNAMGAIRALECACFAILSDGKHRISFDEAVVTMVQTGHDLIPSYRETSKAGLATTWNLDENH